MSRLDGIQKIIVARLVLKDKTLFLGWMKGIQGFTSFRPNLLLLFGHPHDHFRLQLAPLLHHQNPN